MDAEGTIAINQTNKDTDKLHIKVWDKRFPHKNKTAIPITLVCGSDRYPNAHIRATEGVPYPCWISNPQLKRKEEKLGEFLTRNGFKNKDRIYLRVDDLPAQPFVIEIFKLGKFSLEPKQTFPDEIPPSKNVIEGAKKSVAVNKYERHLGAREKCIEQHGCYCVACELDFSEKYGEHGRGFIHVHHLKPISEIGAEYELDPVADLRPVCPNCHAMIHRASPILSIDELRKILGKPPLSE